MKTPQPPIPSSKVKKKISWSLPYSLDLLGIHFWNRNVYPMHSLLLYFEAHNLFGFIGSQLKSNLESHLYLI